MKISVLIPTWRRPKKLKLALQSLVEQRREANQVVVVYRDIDESALEVINQFRHNLPLTIVEVSLPGVIHAENQAIKKSTGEIICFLDDDAEAPPQWIEIIEKHFSSNTLLGGVGGPDFITGHHDPNYRQNVEQVGKVLSYGKVLGNHHHMTHKALYVDVLKGVNMAFRRSLFPYLDPNLQSDHQEGNGSHWELDVCLQIKKAGHQLLFDPALDVKHHSNHDHFIHTKNLCNNARNMTYVILKNFTLSRKFLFITYVMLIGNSQVIGCLKFIQTCFSTSPKKAITDYYFSLKGFFKGIFIYYRSKKIEN